MANFDKRQAMEIQWMLLTVDWCTGLVLLFGCFQMVLLNIHMQLKRRSENLTSHKEAISAILIWIVKVLFCFILYKVISNNMVTQAVILFKSFGSNEQLAYNRVSGSHLLSLTDKIDKPYCYSVRENHDSSTFQSDYVFVVFIGLD